MLPLRDNIPTRRFPVVTVALIAANVGGLALGGHRHARRPGRLQVRLLPVHGAAAVPPASRSEPAGGALSWWDGAFTSMFMHGSWAHILGNMLFLWIFGNNVEDALGRFRFLIWYLVAGLVATATQTFVTLVFSGAEAASVPNIGASGAVSGVLGRVSPALSDGEGADALRLAADRGPGLSLPRLLVLLPAVVRELLGHGARSRGRASPSSRTSAGSCSGPPPSTSWRNTVPCAVSADPLTAMRTYVRVREAGILHADADAFFASVEQRDDPRLRGRPVAVGGGVVMAASYEARRFGVRGAMGGRRARRLCPDLIVVPPRFQAYVDASRALFRVFEDAAPVVEGMSLDEAFLDVRGLERIAGTPREIALRLKRTVREEVGLPLTVGIATAKVVAKVASGVAKPDGLLLVPAGKELAFLHPLPVEQIWGIGPATTARKLHACGILSVGRAAQHSEAYLAAVLGPAAARYLHAVAHNRDQRRVRPTRGRRSVGSQSAGRHSLETVDAVLIGLVDRVAYRMRAAGRRGRTVVLRLRFDDFSRVTRSQTLPEPTAATQTILAATRTLLGDAMPTIRRRGLTLVGITVANLDDGIRGRQLTIPLEHPSVAGFDVALDAVRERFGRDAITVAVLLHRRRGASRSPLDGVSPARPCMTDHSMRTFVDHSLRKTAPAEPCRRLGSTATDELGRRRPSPPSRRTEPTTGVETQ